jgi:hypothetical protein
LCPKMHTSGHKNSDVYSYRRYSLKKTILFFSGTNVG